MFDILKYQEIVIHINNSSSIYKLNSRNDWIQILCPYCDDATRSSKIDHGHFYISRYFNYCHCFRCDTKTTIKQFLKYTGFNNNELLNSIFRTKSNYIHLNENKLSISKKIDIYSIIEQFPKEKLSIFDDYLGKRLLNIDHELFKIYPSYEESTDTIFCNFNNYYNEFSAARIIKSNKYNYRYLKKENSKFYFFQNPFDHESITICEGPFDIINLYNFTNKFHDSCFFSINGKSYISSVIKIISLYYLSNLKLNINIIFDSDIKNIDFIKKKMISKLNILNNNILTNFYKPTVSKDVSDILLLQEV